MIDFIVQNSFMVAQIFGVLAFSLQVIAWQLKAPRLIILIHAPINLLWSAQFYLLGALIGCFHSLACALKDAVLFGVHTKYLPIVIGMYLLTCFLIAINFSTNWYGVLPFLGTFVLNIAMLKRDNRKLIARAYIVSIMCWMVYNYFSAAYVTMTCDAIVAVTVVIGMARFEKWQIGKCYKTFLPSIHRAIFNFTPQTYP